MKKILVLFLCFAICFAVGCSVQEDGRFYELYKCEKARVVIDTSESTIYAITKQGQWVFITTTRAKDENDFKKRKEVVQSYLEDFTYRNYIYKECEKSEHYEIIVLFNRYFIVSKDGYFSPLIDKNGKHKLYGDNFLI